MLSREKTIFNMIFLDKPILGRLKACFDLLNQDFFHKLNLSVKSSWSQLLGNAVSRKNNV